MLRQIARALISKTLIPNLLPKPLNFPADLSIPRQNAIRSSTSTITRFSFSTDSAKFDQNKEIDEINLKFAEAREEIESAMDSKETVYFNEEAECAREAVGVVLSKFDALLEKLDEKERMGVRRSMGLKIEQLKAELKQLEE